MILLTDNLALLLTLGVLIFLIVIVFLVVMLLYAKAKLAPSGPVTLSINDDIKLDVESGSTILSTLSNEKIFLPSACGGGGTCGMCRCQVTSGGGHILPTEVGFFSRKQIHDHWRLGCQVKVRENMEIKVPKEIFGIKKWECEVISNNNVATYIKEFKVKLPDGENLDFLPGGYIQIDVPKCEVDFKNIDVDEKYKVDWECFKMFDMKMKNLEPIYRAYSMANYPAEKNVIMLNIRIATPPWDKAKNDFMKVNPGICSSYIFSRRPGDKVTISGPYGEFHIKQTNKEMVYIGGGAGMAPLRSHTFHLFKTEGTKRKVSYWYGARSSREVFYEDEFRAMEKEFPNFQFNLALSEPLLEDNWTGYVGYIHQVLLDNYLSKHDEPEEIEFYLCGPPQMNDAVFKMLDELGVPKENIAFDDFGG
ncbi:MAG: NADH:ubiquinone reductase (Na(+)-transporting) subunit F [Bacteroidales bacterium]|nr:MAG: NADH:ubiquinone reductase (Na(+)-transporting) subunit F [Bacteroidales bacterium]